MAEDTTQSKDNKGISASTNNTRRGPLPGIGIDVEINSESQLSNFIEDPRRNHSSKNADSHIYSNNHLRSNVPYPESSVLSTAARPISSMIHSSSINRNHSVTMSGQGNAPPMAQMSARSLGFVPTMNLNRQHINDFEASLNAAEVINNANLSRLRSQNLFPDANASFSSRNGFAYHKHQRFPAEFVPQLSQRTHHGSLSLMEDNHLPLHHAREGQRYHSGQSSLTEGRVGDAARTMTMGAGSKKGNDSMTKRGRAEDRIASDLSITKRARNLVQIEYLTQKQQQLLNSDSLGQLQWGNVSGRFYSMYAEEDAENLSHYQCLVRKQIEIFEATSVDACTNAQGRNRPILPGQVGIRCRHCYKIPLKQRKTGSVYYPNRVSPACIKLNVFMAALFLVFLFSNNVNQQSWIYKHCSW